MFNKIGEQIKPITQSYDEFQRINEENEKIFNDQREEIKSLKHELKIMEIEYRKIKSANESMSKLIVNGNESEKKLKQMIKDLSQLI